MKNFKVFLCMLFICLSSFAQNIKVKGVVTDKSGPVMGVTVRVKGSKLSAITDSNGQYYINAPLNSTLQFSFVGYDNIDRQVEKGGVMDVQLSDKVNAINEVVVTAIGIKQQVKKLGYTTQEVSGEKLAASGTVNVASSLSGEVAGLTVSNPSGMFEAPTFSLRGNSPLIVLDGVPIESDLYDISSDNIESINVLKGTAASALYGSRGKDGAIMITTKTAKKRGVEVSFSTKDMASAGYVAFPKTQKSYGSGSEGQYEFWDGQGGGKSDDDMEWGPKLNVGNMASQWNSPIKDKVTGEEIQWYGDVEGTKYDDKSRYERVLMPLVSHDNLKTFLETGLITNNNLSINYKGDKASVSVIGQYAYQKGQAPTTSIQTGGLNINSSFDLADNLTLNANLDYNGLYTPNYPDYGYHPSNYMYTIVEWMGADINGKDLRDHQWVPGMEGYRQANYNYAWYNNPWFAIEQGKRIEHRNVVTGQLRLNYQILPSLSIMGRASMRQQSINDEHKSPKSYMNYGDSRAGDYKVWNTSQNNIDADILATYTKYLLNDVNMTVNAGASMFHRNYRNDYESTDGLNVPGIYNLSNSTGAIMINDSGNPLWGTRSEKEIRSVYGTIDFDFSKYAYLTLTGRNDWSSTLSKGNNSYFYPSVSLSSVISDYVKLPQLFDYLKVRGSWAAVSSDLDPYQIQEVYTKLNDWGTTPMVTYPDAMVNSNIKPQKTISFELGLSTSLYKRVSLDFTYFHNLDENQILDMSISQASGFSTHKINGNKYTTNGVEFMANVKAIQNRDFNWNVNLNMSHMVKKLSEIYGGAEYFGDMKKGDRADSYFGTVWQRASNGDLIVDATGQPIKDSYDRNVGHTDPDLRYGLQNTFKYKDLTLNIDIDGGIGGVIYSTLSPKLWWGGKHPKSVTYRDEEYNTGKPVYVPDAVVVTGGSVQYDANGHVVSDTRTYAKNTLAVEWQSWCQNYPYRALVTDKMDKTYANTFNRTYLKVRYISLSYDFHKILAKECPVKGLTANVFCNNVLLWSKAPWIDPDISGDTASNNGAEDPTARYIGLGINLKF